MAAAIAEARADRSWRIVTTVVTAAVLLLVAAYAARAATALKQVSLARGATALADRSGEARATLAGLSDATVHLAMAASPLSARIGNVAMAKAVDAGATPASWMRHLTRLGWRDTAMLQNSLFVSAESGDIGAILDAVDALLRRRERIEQVVPVLTTLEGDPEMRALLARRLAGGPSWRSAYLSTAGHLRSDEQLENRYALLQEIAAVDTVSEGEAAFTSRLFQAGGRQDLAAAIWRRAVPSSGLLADPNFQRAAARSGLDADENVADFDWQVLTGEGFNSSAVVEDGRARLSIDWDGRGVPVLARVRTFAQPGRYRLSVSAAPADKATLSVLAFRLLCQQGAVTLPVAGMTGERGISSDTVSCAYPILEISGELQPSTTALHLDLLSLRLMPVK